MSLLESINSPADLRRLSIDKLSQVASELRDLMISVVSQNGGHLASNLGTVELSIALHYAYATPYDKIIWDVGHQAYAHKILTGRRDAFSSLRQYNGLSGFPRRGESEYDVLSVGHASTSISAALGMAAARDLKEEKYSVVAVIGDGSLSGGLALEGLNNLGSSNTNLTVVLNDNEMSISRNVGALSRYLTRMMTDKRYNRLKSEIWELLGSLSNVGKGIRSLVSGIDDALKHLLIPGKLFEDMGLRYIGPFDGHDTAGLIEVFRAVRNISKQPVLVHVLTKKGKGYGFAENDSTKFHGIGCFSPMTGTIPSTPNKAPTFSDVFGSTIVELADQNPNIVTITAAMCEGTRLNRFKEKFPTRFFDVGIAEEHAVTFAAGLALQGMKPFVALYSTFLQRAYDQIMHDIALDKVPVVFCIDRAGLVGDDGPTHHGMFDISFLRTVPGACIMAPRDESQLRNMLYTAAKNQNGPSFIRYPRGVGLGAPIDSPMSELPIGIPELVSEGDSECALISVGDMYKLSLEIQKRLTKCGISPTLIDARFVKPLDLQSYAEIFEKYHSIITLENNSLAGGFGSAILELVSSLDLPNPPRILRIGLPDEFITHGETALLHKELGLDPDSVTKKVCKFLDEHTCDSNDIILAQAITASDKSSVSL